MRIHWKELPNGMIVHTLDDPNHASGAPSFSVASVPWVTTRPPESIVIDYDSACALAIFIATARMRHVALAFTGDTRVAGLNAVRKDLLALEIMLCELEQKGAR